MAKQAQDPFLGILRLGTIPAIAPYYLPDLMPKLKQELPKLTVLLQEEKTQRLITALLQGKIDAAILSLPIEVNQLNQAVLFDDPFALAVA